MNGAKIAILISIIAYLLLMIYIGYYFSKKGSGDSSDEFYLGGRKLGPIVAAMSAEASDMSGWLLMGLPGVAYLTGVCDAGWTAIGLAIGTYLNWLLVAKRLRKYTIVTNSITLPDFFSKRFKDTKNILMCISAIIIIVFFIPYTASGFKSVGTLFNSLFGVDYHLAMIIGAIVIVGYTILGGFMAVSTTDLIQSIVMSIALIVITLFALNVAGGLEAVSANASNMDGYLSFSKMFDVSTGTSSSYGFITTCSTLAWGLGYFGMPHILLRFMAIEDEAKVATSRRIASVWVVISMAVAIFIGVIGYSVSLKGNIPLFGTSAEAETVIIQISSLLSENGIIFALIAGVVLAGILACTMSTADSQLLTASSSVSQNLIQDVMKVKLDSKKSILLARLTIIAISICAAFMAWNPNSSVFTIVSFAWAGFGASFGPLVLFSLYWKRMNLPGALAGMVSGALTIFVWKFMIRPLGGVWNIYELLPAFIVASVAIVVVSLITKAPSKEIEEEFEASKKVI
ncbi:MAG: sodium/proline symporter PutP [Bacillota bacterium]|nr:sodium/proline symporter PutP [Bacillota bacterium]